MTNRLPGEDDNGEANDEGDVRAAPAPSLAPPSPHCLRHNLPRQPLTPPPPPLSPLRLTPHQGDEELSGGSSDGGKSDDDSSSGGTEEADVELPDYYDVDDAFIDDSDLLEADHVDGRKAKHSGFYVNKARSWGGGSRQPIALRPSPGLEFVSLATFKSDWWAELTRFALPRHKQGKIERDGAIEPLQPVFQPSMKRKLEPARGKTDRLNLMCRPILFVSERALVALETGPADCFRRALLPQKAPGAGPPKARKIMAQPVPRQPGAGGFPAPAPRPPSVPALSAAAQTNSATLQAMADDPLASLFAPKQMGAPAPARPRARVLRSSPHSPFSALLCAPRASNPTRATHSRASRLAPRRTLRRTTTPASSPLAVRSQPALTCAPHSIVFISPKCSPPSPPLRPSLTGAASNSPVLPPEGGAKRQRAPVEYDPPPQLVPIFNELRDAIARVRHPCTRAHTPFFLRPPPFYSPNPHVGGCSARRRCPARAL